MDKALIFIAMAGYMSIIIGIGFYYYKRSNESSDNFFLGGRSLGPWVAAISAGASDMSGWLLMGLPGVAYWSGLSDAFWTAIGLAAGTALNWIIVSKRLRHYSESARAITLPEFFSNRFHEDKRVILTVSSTFIFVFFSVYAASCFVTVGKLFATLFEVPYIPMMIAGAVFVVFYTFIGGFLAESVSDFMQGIIMIAALAVVLVGGVVHAGGPGEVIDNLRGIPGFLDFFGIATPTLIDGVQQADGALAAFGPAGKYGLITIASSMAWGLGYFGMPQVLLRFMAIRSAEDIKQSRRIGIIWTTLSLTASVLIGLIGRAMFPMALTTAATSETIFIEMATLLFPPLLAGIVMSGILAATISSADSYLLIAASAFSKNIYKGVLRKDASDQQIMAMTRMILIVLAIVGIIIALDENSVIFTIVSFAWAGFGATFGPLMLFSLFWKKTTRQGAIAGMLTGGIAVFIWKLLIKPIGGVFGIYELLPAFILSCVAIVIFSLIGEKPSAAMEEEFEMVKSQSKA